MTISISSLSLRSYASDKSSHSHDFAQIVLAVKGVMELQTGNNYGLVNTKTGAFIAPGETHCFAASHENSFLVVDIKEPKLISQMRQVPVFLALSTAAEQFLVFVQTYLSGKENDLLSDYLVQNLLIKLLTAELGSQVDQTVLLAKHWIDKHFTQAINLNKLAKICHLSTSQLQRRFKQATTQTLAEYWRAKKLSFAQLLLSIENLSIETIAFQIGYENLSAFSRRFTQVFGLSPSQWREQQTQCAKKINTP